MGDKIRVYVYLPEGREPSFHALAKPPTHDVRLFHGQTEKQERRHTPACGREKRIAGCRVAQRCKPGSIEQRKVSQLCQFLVAKRQILRIPSRLLELPLCWSCKVSSEISCVQPVCTLLSPTHTNTRPVKPIWFPNVSHQVAPCHFWHDNAAAPIPLQDGQWRGFPGSAKSWCSFSSWNLPKSNCIHDIHDSKDAHIYIQVS